MRAILYLILAIFLLGCSSSNKQVTAGGLEVQLEDILVTLDPDKQIISAKVCNEETYPVVDFTKYNTTSSDNFYCAISKSEEADDVVLKYRNDEQAERQLLIKKEQILFLSSRALFGAELQVATPAEVEEFNNMKRVKIYTDTINWIEHSFD